MLECTGSVWLNVQVLAWFFHQVSLSSKALISAICLYNKDSLVSWSAGDAEWLDLRMRQHRCYYITQILKYCAREAFIYRWMMMNILHCLSEGHINSTSSNSQPNRHKSERNACNSVNQICNSPAQTSVKRKRLKKNKPNQFLWTLPWEQLAVSYCFIQYTSNKTNNLCHVSVMYLYKMC